MFVAERKTPDLGAGLFAVSCKEDSVVFGEYSDGCLLKDYAAAVVAYGGYAHQVMMELWHDLGGCVWYGGEEDIARRRGAVGGAT